MEASPSNKKKSSQGTGIIVALIVFALVALGLGAYLIYDKLIAYKEDKPTPATEQTVNDDNHAKNETTPTISLTQFDTDSIALVYNGSVYVNVTGDYTTINTLFGDGTYEILNDTRNNYSKYNFDSFNYSSSTNGELGWQKLDIDNIKAAYSYVYGQDVNSDSGLILLGNDGDLYAISMYSLINGISEVTKIDELSNIKKVTTENDMGLITYAIDKSGEKYDLSDYIPSDYTEF